jgi:hypothetical protein
METLLGGKNNIWQSRRLLCGFLLECIDMVTNIRLAQERGRC